MLKTIIKTILVSSALVMSGCVGMETSFKPHDALGGGFGNYKISDNVFVVYFVGNDFTEDFLAKRYFLMHSAQVALNNDFECFVVAEQKPTLIDNYVSNNKLVLKTKYYSADTKNYKGAETNLKNEHSLSGIIQLHAKAVGVVDCQDAKQILETYRVN